MPKFFLLAICTIANSFLFAQNNLTNYAREAAVVTKMVEKFHVQPKAVDNVFSAIVFDRLIKQLDPQKIFFTTADIQILTVYKDKVDDDIKNRKVIFLETISTNYQKRISTADTMMNNICLKPFNFSLAEKITVAEDTSYAANDAALHTKLYKMVKRSILLSLLHYQTRISSLSPIQQQKFIDSAEMVFRKKINTTFKRSISRKIERPGGLNQLVGVEYCKAIANCFDPHTEYMPVTEKEDFESELGKKAMGFGFKLDEDENGRVSINELQAGSPAFKSGQLNQGDMIESVQWEGKQAIDVTTASIEEVVRILSVSNHDKAVLKIKKADGSTRNVSLFKEQLEADEADAEKVKSYLLKGVKTIGYISLPAFYEDWENEEANVNGCANDVAKEILKLKAEKMEGLIIDVRYNGGGSMQEAIELAGIFIDAGPVAMVKTREQKVLTLKDVNRGTIYDGPLMIMVNGYSASASEMFAGTLQDYKRAVIAGAPTYGKATAQVILPMDTTITLDNDFSNKNTRSYIKTTVSQLYRVNGTTAQASGVIPDVLLPDMLEANAEREGNEPLAIRALNIDANKYYKAGAPLPLASLKASAKSIVNASEYFKKINSYVNFIDRSKQQKDMSLRLSDALVLVEKNEQDIPEFDSAKQVANFKVINNAYELQRMKTNAKLAAVNEEWKQALSKDPYINVIYDLIISMIK